MINNRYLSLQILGAGGYGSVYLVEDTRNNTKAALKFLANVNADTLSRFKREAKVMQQNVHNPHVIKLLDYNFSHAPPYIVMEYCEYGTLRTWVTTRQPWQAITAALAHIVQGLHNIHLLGGFHRDLKPDNVLVAKHPLEPDKVIIKVSDFGLARVPDAANSPMTRGHGGTPGYIAPEVLAGAPYTSSSDMYSLGIVASELLTGVTGGDALGQASMPEQLRRIVRLMLSQDPRARPTIQDVAKVLHTLLNSPNVIAAPEEIPKPLSNSNSGVGGLIFGSLLAGGFLLALAALASDEAKPNGSPGN